MQQIFSFSGYRIMKSKFRIGDNVVATSNLSLEELQAQTDELHLHVGRCLGMWSSVERSLTLLFLCLHDKIDEPFPLVKVFNGVVSFEVRLSMINLAVQHDERTTEKFRTQWNALFNKLSKSYRKRHEIAHFTIITDHTESTSPKTTLQPFYTAFSPPGIGLSAKDLIERERSFLSLSKRIDRFWWHVLLVRGARAECPFSITDPDHLIDNPFVPVDEGR